MWSFNDKIALSNTWMYIVDIAKLEAQFWPAVGQAMYVQFGGFGNCRVHQINSKWRDLK